MKIKAYIFVLDGLTAEISEKLELALKSVDIIINVKIDMQSGLVEIGSARNPETQLKMACSIVGCKLRTHVKKRQL